MGEIDYEALGARLLRPDRPGLVEARAVVAGISDPRAAWEALAARGVIPATWVQDPQRGFPPDTMKLSTVSTDAWLDQSAMRTAQGSVVFWPPWRTAAAAAEAERAAGRSVVALPRQGTCEMAFFDPDDTPRTVRDCLALASDPSGMLAVEQLAVETVRRLRALGGFFDAPRIERWFWCVGERRDWHLNGPPAKPWSTRWLLSGPYFSSRVVTDAIDAAAWRAYFTVLGPREPKGLRRLAALDARADCRWRLLATRSDAPLAELLDRPDDVTRSVGAEPSLADLRLRDVPDPFEPLMAIWQRGYAFQGVADDAFVLVAPEAA